MRNLFIYMLLTCTFTIACKKSFESETSTFSKSDTIFLNNQGVLFISPDDKDIDNLKKQQGDDFYTIADDANNYFSEASTYLDSMKIPYKNYNSDHIIGFKTNEKFVEIPKYKNPWYLIFYQNGKYKVLDLIDVREEYPKFFNSRKPTNSMNLDSKRIIDSVAGNKYFVVEERDCDLNNDTFKDKIIILGNNNDVDPHDPDTRIAPILILLNEQNERYKILTNQYIYPNNFGDAFKRLVVKNQFFTIELSNEVPDKYISNKYITFRYDEKAGEIVLSKYGEIIHWNDGEKNNILCSEKNFGKISFQEFSSNEIQNKCPQ
ncbi:MAG: hypothetical protein LBV25_14105 [Chryseobacterium sp.]|nr:hypothetical protein [Chryseobacterium sp.]